MLTQKKISSAGEQRSEAMNQTNFGECRRRKIWRSKWMMRSEPFIKKQNARSYVHRCQMIICSCRFASACFFSSVIEREKRDKIKSPRQRDIKMLIVNFLFL